MENDASQTLGLLNGLLEADAHGERVQSLVLDGAGWLDAGTPIAARIVRTGRAAMTADPLLVSSCILHGPLPTDDDQFAVYSVTVGKKETLRIAIVHDDGRINEVRRVSTRAMPVWVHELLLDFGGPHADSFEKIHGAEAAQGARARLERRRNDWSARLTEATRRDLRRESRAVTEQRHRQSR